MTYDIEYYSGMNIPNRLEGLARDVFLTNWEYMHQAFGDNVEFERLAYQTLLCSQTVDYLYAKPEPVSYVRGTRPILDKVVDEVCAGCNTDREKALALLSFIRDLRLKVDGRDYFYGGTEEELIKKGERYCERVARLMVALCEIAGMPGRIIFHLTTGHLTNEIYLEDGWAYFDPRFGMFCVDENNHLMSVNDIINCPSMIYNQPQWVYDYYSPEYGMEYKLKRNYDRYLCKKEVQLYGDYSLCHADRYHFNWMPSIIYPVKKRDDAHRKYQAAIENYYSSDQYIDGVYAK
jgi:transglutaminase-like putative cysteine protease